jgi:hypothetical protein
MRERHKNIFRGIMSEIFPGMEKENRLATGST